MWLFLSNVNRRKMPGLKSKTRPTNECLVPVVVGGSLRKRYAQYLCALLSLSVVV